eukprot:c8107_g3_i1.p1 GENE.c8107_g3_i1~~c8107_g3_i1.p1  ORF type:complete len:273 (+),score=83.18 c8107_g3_i1:1-819(+)
MGDHKAAESRRGKIRDRKKTVSQADDELMEDDEFDSDHNSPTHAPKSRKFDPLRQRKMKPPSWRLMRPNNRSTSMRMNQLRKSAIRSSRTPTSRRHSAPSVFDIDNIVIPLGMASNSVVVKKEVKEIVVPSWRYVRPQTSDAHSPLPLPSSLPISAEEEYSSHEDTSDETFSRRHKSREANERKVVADALAAARGTRKRAVSTTNTPHSNYSTIAVDGAEDDKLSTQSSSQQRKDSRKRAVSFQLEPLPDSNSGGGGGAQTNLESDSVLLSD